MAALSPTTIDLTRGDLWTFPFRWLDADGNSAIPSGGKMAGLIAGKWGSIDLTVANGRVEQDEGTGEFVLTLEMAQTANVAHGNGSTLSVISYDASLDRVVQAIYRLHVRQLGS